MTKQSTRFSDDTTLTFDDFTNYLYTSYCEYVGGKAFNGDPLPSWREFSTDPTKEKQANAWRGVAAVAHNFMVMLNTQPKEFEKHIKDILR